MLAHRLRRWANISPALGLRVAFDWYPSASGGVCWSVRQVLKRLMSLSDLQNATSPHIYTPPCTAKRRYLFILQVSRYRLSALQNCTGTRSRRNILWIRLCWSRNCDSQQSCFSALFLKPHSLPKLMFHFAGFLLINWIIFISDVWYTYTVHSCLALVICGLKAHALIFVDPSVFLSWMLVIRLKTNYFCEAFGILEKIWFSRLFVSLMEMSHIFFDLSLNPFRILTSIDVRFVMAVDP